MVDRKFPPNQSFFIDKLRFIVILNLSGLSLIIYYGIRKMRLIVEWEYGEGDSYINYTLPVICENVDKFIQLYEEAWFECKSTVESDYLHNYNFQVCGWEFNFEWLCKVIYDQEMSPIDYGIIYPNVYTVDEWFSEAENE